MMDYVLKLQSKVNIRKKNFINKFKVRSDYDLIKVTKIKGKTHTGHGTRCCHE